MLLLFDSAAAKLDVLILLSLRCLSASSLLFLLRMRPSHPLRPSHLARPSHPKDESSINDRHKVYETTINFHHKLGPQKSHRL